MSVSSVIVSSSLPRLTIASRESRLAMWQAEHVRDQLRAAYPSAIVSILGMTTRGDQILDRSLAQVGGKGLFIKELEVALSEERADLAVHSLKDVPMDLPDGFTLAAVMQREDPRDAWVSSRYAHPSALPAGAVIGTSSPRRAALLRARYPALRIEPLRGNLDTRLAKLDRGDFAGIVLACAGLKRLGLATRIRSVLEPDELLPAVGQGALAIEVATHRSDLLAALKVLDDRASHCCARAERAVARALGGSCYTPMAVYATHEPASDQLHMRAMVAAADGSAVVAAASSGPADAPEALGLAVAAQLLANGAQALLQQPA